MNHFTFNSYFMKREVYDWSYWAFNHQLSVDVLCDHTSASRKGIFFTGILPLHVLRTWNTSTHQIEIFYITVACHQKLFQHVKFLFIFVLLGGKNYVIYIFVHKGIPWCWFESNSLIMRSIESQYMSCQYRLSVCLVSLQWRDSVQNHRPHGCLLNRIFCRRSKKTSKLRLTGLCAGNSPGAGEFPAQTTRNAENVSIWWRHHVAMKWTENRLTWQAGV